MGGCSHDYLDSLKLGKARNSFKWIPTCLPIYLSNANTSTNSIFRLTSEATHPVMQFYYWILLGTVMWDICDIGKRISWNSFRTAKLEMLFIQRHLEFQPFLKNEPSPTSFLLIFVLSNNNNFADERFELGSSEYKLSKTLKFQLKAPSNSSFKACSDNSNSAVTSD